MLSQYQTLLRVRGSGTETTFHVMHFPSRLSCAIHRHLSPIFWHTVDVSRMHTLTYTNPHSHTHSLTHTHTHTHTPSHAHTHTPSHAHTGVEDPSLEYCTQLINRYEPTDEGKAQGLMSNDGEGRGCMTVG